MLPLTDSGTTDRAARPQAVHRASVTVAPVLPHRLLECQQLAAEVFGFSPLLTVPAWEMLVAARHGALALAAMDADRLVGFSYAFAAFDGREAYLFANGLAVRPEFRSAGVGTALKLAQREHALRLGYRVIRWTVSPLSSAALYLYLNRLGAEIVGYQAEPYENQLKGSPNDEADVEWRLDDAGGGPRSHDVVGEPEGLVTRTEALRDGLRALVDVDTDGRLGRSRSMSWPPDAFLEIPWDAAALDRANADKSTVWRRGLRHAVPTLIAQGLRGVGLCVDRRARRSFLHFSRVDG